MRKLLLYPILFFACQSASMSQTFTDSNLPIVVINTYGQNIETPYAKFYVGMGIIDNGPGNRNYLSDPYNSYNGEVEIKMRGSSSLWLPKKSYNITTVDAIHQKVKTSILGMPSEDDWVMYAPYQDKTCLRNNVAFRIFNAMGHYSSRSVFFELVIDGTYQGLYEMQEKIKRNPNRVNISKLKFDEVTGDDVTGGYIIKLDKYLPGEEGWYSSHYSNATHDSANFFLYEYPKPDSMPIQQRNYIKGFFDVFENTVAAPYYASVDSGYSRYIDMQSFIDNLIVNELAKNVDGYRSSTYFYKDRDSQNSKLYAGPLWDFNLGFDNCDYNGGHNPAGWMYQQDAYHNFVPFWWERFMSDDNFKNQLKCRYQQLRNNVLSTAALYEHIDSMAIFLNESQTRNFQRWPIMGTAVPPNPTPVPPDYAGEITNLKNWIQNRLTWLDANMPGSCFVGVEENVSSDHLISSYPNPFTNNINLVYRVPSSTTVKIDLINLLGEVVMPVSSAERAAGEYQEEVQAEQLGAGIYLVRLSMNGKVHYHKMVKVAGN
jgi:hypothetical protein